MIGSGEKEQPNRTEEMQTCRRLRVLLVSAIGALQVAEAGTVATYQFYDEAATYLLFEITDDQGKMVRRIKKSVAKGVNRLSWDLRYAPKDPVTLNRSSPFYNPFGGGEPTGPKVYPGDYTVTMYMHSNGEKKAMGQPQTFKVKSLNNKVLPADDYKELAAFHAKVDVLAGRISGAGRAIREMNNQIRHIKVAMMQIEDNEGLAKDVLTLEKKITEINLKLYGDRNAARLDMATAPTVNSRIGFASWGTTNTSSGPTKSQIDAYNIALEEFEPILGEIRSAVEEDLPAINAALVKAGAPYTPGTLPTLDDLK